MPACPRSDVVCVGEVGVYHCWSRCVRRAFLCGQDPLTGKDYEYRREWIRDFEECLAGLFGIEVGFHAELSNHIHLVLRTRPDVVDSWSDEEVVRRWLGISHLTKSRNGQPREIFPARIALEMAIPHRVDKLRTRLSDPSFFMAALCEHVGRRSNRDDQCSGTFWEDRYKCRQLADEGAVLICGIYVDLNQIRAGEAFTPETSTHTSACDRIRSRMQRLSAEAQAPEQAVEPHKLPDGWLCELTIDESESTDRRAVVRGTNSRRASDKGMLPITLNDYLELLDASGRMLRDDKVGAIPTEFAPILERLGVRPAAWSELVENYHDWFGTSLVLPRRSPEEPLKWDATGFVASLVVQRRLARFLQSGETFRRKSLVCNGGSRWRVGFLVPQLVSCIHK
ncbi:MAG TPA: hypothetical protein QF564_31785 [Pirellulaceae bacterium]|nr:hypothetical protein [Pirellulaceae bacterium]